MLKNAGDQFTHPKTGKPMKLFRIKAEKDFITHGRTVREGEIGGYIQSETNLAQTDHSWVFNTAQVFDNAILIDSIVTDSAKVYGEACVVDSKILQNAQVKENSHVESSVIRGRVNVDGSAEVTASDVSNASIICHHAKVNKCIVSDGVRISGNSVATDSKLSDTSEIRGSTVVENCHVSGRTVLNSGKYLNQNIHTDLELNVLSGKE